MPLTYTRLMRNGTVVAWLLLVGVSMAVSQPLADSGPPRPKMPTLNAYCQQFHTLYINIREQTISPNTARRTFSQIMMGLRGRFYGPTTDTLYLRPARQANALPPDSLPVTNARDSTETDSLYIDNPADSSQTDSMVVNRVGATKPDSMVIVRRPGAPKTLGRFVFPLRGYGPSAIGGTHGEGYRGKGFDLFDYTVRGSHPAQDIFIRDQNQDHIDDRTGHPVDILAVRSGLVLAIETGWQPGSEYRGGNWIWVYDPVLHGLWYYAHNNVVSVKPGQWVEAGDKLSEMGRTGFNAYQARSPTHLHLMYLQIQPNGLPLPVNTYGWLRQATIINTR